MRILIIGAGMAGLAAAHALKNTSHEVILLEGRNRIGGRVYSDRTFVEHPMEMGAEFLHGERIPLWKFVQKLNLRTIHWRKTNDSLVRLENGDLLTMQEARAKYPDFDVTRSWDLPPAPVKEGDESLTDYLRRLGFTEAQIQYTRRSFANAQCEAPEVLSAQDCLHHFMGGEMGEEDHRILDGYSRIAEHLAEGLDIRLNHAVGYIEWGEQGVRVMTLDSQWFSADYALITLPVGVLQRGTVRFWPELPPSKKEALAKLSMAPALKLLFRFTESPVPAGIGAFYSAKNPPMWWSPTVGHGVEGMHMWTALATGPWARELLAQGEAGALQMALESFRAEVGKPDLTPTHTRLVNWGDDPFTLGGYSAVKVGGEGAREALAERCGRLLWAGEATASGEHSATVHGAYMSGTRAAAELIAL